MKHMTEMPNKSLPEELTIKFKNGGKDIEVSVGGTVFPFPISQFMVTFTPEKGADYSISAGSSMSTGFELQVDKPTKEELQEVIFQSTESILNTSQDVLTPDSAGVLSLEVDEAPLDSELVGMLNKAIPERSKLIMKNVPNSYSFNSFRTVMTQEKAYTENNVGEVVGGLMGEFIDNEREIIEECKGAGVLKTIKKPTVVFEDGVLYITEKLGVYDR